MIKPARTALFIWIAAMFISSVTLAADTCGLPSPGAGLAAIDEFAKIQNLAGAGDQFHCAATNGIWVTPSGDSVRMGLLDSNLITSVHGWKNYQAISTIEVPGSAPGAALEGLMVNRDGRWYRASLKSGPVSVDRKRSAIERISIALENKIAQNRDDKEIEIEEVKFDDKMTSMESTSGGAWRFNGRKSIEDFVKTHPKKVSNALEYLDAKNVRVPPEMYSLLENKEFVRARENKDYSAMMDMIWKKALEVSGGDAFNANFIALLVSDMRRRGPCGAAFGARGRTMIPSSIFDGEKPSELITNRLDAPQHFFGYGLLSRLTGKDLAKIQSTASKEQQYYLPKVANFFIGLHTYTDKDAGLDPYRTTSFQATAMLKERTRNDIDVDKFYNELGIEFAARTMKAEDALPSGVLNDPSFDSKRESLGLGYVGQKDWQAYSPPGDEPKVISLPAEERNPVERSLPSGLWSRAVDGFDEAQLKACVSTSMPDEKRPRMLSCMKMGGDFEDRIEELKSKTGKFSGEELASLVYVCRNDANDWKRSLGCSLANRDLARTAAELRARGIEDHKNARSQKP